MNVWLRSGILLLFWLPASSVRAELLLYLSFDEGGGSVARDAAGRGNDGQLSSSAGFAKGKFGTALDLGGTDNGAFVKLPTALGGAFDSIVKTQSATIAFWMNRQGHATSESAAAFFLDGGDSGLDPVQGRQLAANVPWVDNRVYFDTGGCCGSNQRISTSGPGNAADGWVHLAFVRDQNSTWVYMDGEVIASSRTGAITSAVSPIKRAGIGYNNEGRMHRYYGSQPGLIDDFAIWDEALSHDIIRQLASGQTVMPKAARGRVVRAAKTPEKYDQWLNRLLLGISTTVAVLFGVLLIRGRRR